MLTPHDMLWGIVFPAIVALMATIAGQLGVRRDRTTQPWGPALAVAGGFAAAYFGIVGRLPHVPPAAAQGWLVYLAGAAVIVAILAAALPRSQGWLVAVLSIVMLALAAWLLSRPRARVLDVRTFRGTVAAAATGMVVWWAAMEGLARRREGAALPLLLSAAAGATALVLVNAHSQSLGQIAGGVAVALLLIAVAGLWFRNLSLSRGGVLAVVLTLLGLTLCGYYFADLTARELLILMAAPLTLWAGEIPPLRRRPWVRFIVPAVLMLAVLSIVLIPAAKGLKQTMDEERSYQY